MSAAFTPGPWSVDGNSLVVAPEPNERGEYKAVAKVHHNASANARLIAAAPDLYEALERLLEEFVDPQQGLEQFDSAITRKSVELALAALGKAR